MNMLSRDAFLNLDRFFSPASFPSIDKELSESFFQPRVNIEEKADSFLITAELAGVKKDDLEVHLEEGVLSLKASVNAESNDEKDGKVIRRERRSGTYIRSFNVGKELSESDISANFEHGLLSISLPKKSEQEPKRKVINVS